MANTDSRAIWRTIWFTSAGGPLYPQVKIPVTLLNVEPPTAHSDDLSRHAVYLYILNCIQAAGSLVYCSQSCTTSRGVLGSARSKPLVRGNKKRRWYWYIWLRCIEVESSQREPSHQHCKSYVLSQPLAFCGPAVLIQPCVGSELKMPHQSDWRLAS
jgi:hypothetical protein